jgi:cytidylate kinase
MSREKINIAIDGYSSCGKSTLAKALAKEFGYVYVDSGAMYRCVTLYFLQNNIDLTFDDAIQKALKEIEIDFDENKVFLNGTDVSEEIRSMQISNAVSKVSAIKAVRHAMVYLQQNIGIKQNLVMDGRDIGTTVFPKAQLKIFMTAHPMIRAQRRYKELLENGKSVPLDEVMANLNMRDYEDTHREESPLTQAEDAVVLDNSFMTPQEQLEYVREKLAGIIGG